MPTLMLSLESVWSAESGICGRSHCSGDHGFLHNSGVFLGTVRNISLSSQDHVRL